MAPILDPVNFFWVFSFLDSCGMFSSHLYNSLTHPLKLSIPIGNFSSFLHFGLLTSSFLYNSTLILDDAYDAVDHDDVGDGDNKLIMLISSSLYSLVGICR